MVSHFVLFGDRIVETELLHEKLRAGDHLLMEGRSGLLLEKLPRPEVELPKRQERGNYKEADYPFRIIPEVF